MRRWKMCKGKKKYATETSAGIDMLKLWALDPKEVDNLNVYRCPNCHKWHVGHKPKEMRPRALQNG
jgi:hypothetical protein